MDLFNPSPIQNILPYEGEAVYYGQILTNAKSKHYFERLLKTIIWKNDETIVFGKLITTKRKIAWYGEKDYAYTYSNTTKIANEWSKELLELKTLVEKETNYKFNSCLLNLYHSGDEGMSWHSDNEKSLGENTIIASLSLGAERIFSFKHKSTKITISKLLERGSLLVMQGETQKNWLHRLAPSKKIKTARINLTFRTIITEL
jgi:alkylated DNA repair dioxygenase AlkB